MKTHRTKALTAVLVAWFTASANHACADSFVVGPGTSITNEVLDTPDGGRTNVDLSHTVLLPAGTYYATFFHYDAGQAGDVRPFLARSNGLHSYLVLALGGLQNVLGVSTDQTVPFGGSGTFTLGAGTTVYAGISSLQVNPIFMDETLIPASTDHDAGFLDPVSVGATVAGFCCTDLTRQYAFSIDVVPEPSMAVLVALGMAGPLMSRRTRIRNVSRNRRGTF